MVSSRRDRLRGQFSGPIETPGGHKVAAPASRQPKSVRPGSATIIDVEAGGSVRATASGDASITGAKAHTGMSLPGAGRARGHQPKRTDRHNRRRLLRHHRSSTGENIISVAGDNNTIVVNPPAAQPVAVGSLGNGPQNHAWPADQSARNGGSRCQISDDLLDSTRAVEKDTSRHGEGARGI